MKLIGVGFWEENTESDMPNPKSLGSWQLSDKTMFELINYLLQCPMFCSYWGMSWCRFECGTSDWEMGNAEYTDGKFVWPQGLIHYLLVHRIQLPKKFIDHCLNNDLAIDELTNIADKKYEIDYDWWISESSILTKENAHSQGQNRKTYNERLPVEVKSRTRKNPKTIFRILKDCFPESWRKVLIYSAKLWLMKSITMEIDNRVLLTCSRILKYENLEMQIIHESTVIR